MAWKKELGILLGIGAISGLIFGPLWWRPANPCLVGDMAARAHGQVPDAVKEIYFDAKRMQFGLGSAALGGWSGLGDAIVAGGVVWVRTTNIRSPKYFSTISNRYFQSNGFVYIAPGQASVSRWRPTHPTSLAQLWQALAEKNPDGVMFSGYVRLAPLRLIAIAQPAIDGRSVRKNAASYYTRPMESAPAAWTYAVGIAVAHPALSRRDHGWLASLLAADPDRADPDVGLAYALQLDSVPGEFNSPPTGIEITALGQLVADATIVAGELKLYPITRIGRCDAVAHIR
ncbi:MAG: hypothetical protein ACYC9J_05435 [Sulfuricaulis sp.]